MKLGVEMRERMKKVKQLWCRCCEDKIEIENLEECWIQGYTIFCSQECIARWNGESLETRGFELKEILRDFGKIREDKEFEIELDEEGKIKSIKGRK